MARETMTRKAADNVYHHMDFHGALSTGISYLEEHYGADAVRAYVRQFARKFYASLIWDIHARGLDALSAYLHGLYTREGGLIRIESSDDELFLEVLLNPAVDHMRRQGYAVAPLFFETSRTLYEALCEDTLYAAEWIRWDEQTGQCAVRFYRRRP